MAVSPTLAPWPPLRLRSKIGPEDWQACIKVWTFLVKKQLLLSDKDFAAAAQSEDQHIVNFLVSYCQDAGNDAFPAPASSPLEELFHFTVFRLAVRTLSLPQPPASLLSFTSLSNICALHGTEPFMRAAWQDVWRRQHLETSTSFTKHKADLISSAASSSPSPKPELEDLLRRMKILVEAIPDYGRFLLAGSELMDALVALWSNASDPLKRKITVVAFFALRSLVLDPKPNASALLDHLYDLKAAAEQNKTGPQDHFLRQLVSNTSLLTILRRRLSDAVRPRATPLITYLLTLDDGTLARRRQTRKGKRAQKEPKQTGNDSFGHGAIGEIHMHRMASISQVQELFPDLGAGFVLKLLGYYHDNVEQATAALLEDSLPADLAHCDRSEQLPSDPSADAMHTHLEPRPTPPLLPQRKNIYDDDDFDQLAISTRNLHIGKKALGQTNPSTAPNDKAAIYSALAAFDSDDDERDDTYDGADVGDSVDVQGHDKDAEDAATDQHTEALYRAWKLDAETFHRDTGSRRSTARAALKTETGMTDEAIEGFAIMLQRDPRRLRMLQMKYPDFTGQQEQISSTKWRQEEEDEGMGVGERSLGRGQGRARGGRGVGGGRGRRRGNVAGASDDKDTQYARQRKDENKAQRGNHNRRAQRAKKVARAGFPG